ncbi:GH92 family glycosyl hydrolase [Actinophytocola oryzae]|uniref:Putative alpha-1,2-mannosidase n=1 Tax=Actinophytocola oryzae TaxID=502181 RepID=A0A4R7V2S1_9PSEU|nr:GH92 family glycosyl hydrolase [Actinophytocola oryzae]TDV43668.1 putative alpha-1,2-mannosidase [Actinophytocola oryzae]
MTTRGFFSSFENTDPPLTWTDTTDLDGNDVPRAAGATLSTREGAGPTRPATAKPRVGFTGVQAMRYAGSHTAAGPGSVTNRLFLLEVAITDDTELSYVILPESTGDDLRFPSTFVALDLVFSDGTSLSDLGARDQLGFPLTARGQGESKALTPDQWNLRRVRLGAAAGRTAVRAVLTYDNPDGPAQFAGWLDDVSIAERPLPEDRRPVDHVVTTRGTDSTRAYSRGNTIPATAVPHGFTFWTPVTDAGAHGWLYSYHRRNTEQNLPALEALAASHLPSPWMGDRQTFQVLPSVAPKRPSTRRRRRRLTFRHGNELARPHHYRVRFTNGVVAEVAPADHAAILRFAFPGEDANLVLDNITRHARLTIDPVAGVVTGYSDVRSGLSEGAGRMFFYATFDRAVTGSGRLWRGLSRKVSGYLKFEPDVDGPTVVTMRVGTSLISVAQAKKNLWLEIADADTFETVLGRAANQWDEVLSRVEVEAATEDQLTTLYSNLYRLYLYPNSGHENTGTDEVPNVAHASPVLPSARKDTPTHTGKAVEAGRIYVNNGFWDTYRTVWPAYTLLTPNHAGELVDGFVQQYREGGWIARWSSPGYADLMTGTSSDVAFADAYRKGVRGFDVRSAYDAAVRNATVTPDRDGVGRKGLDRSIFLGYTPTSTEYGLSWTLEGCLNDFAIAGLAKEFGDTELHDYLLDRAMNYVHSFDPATGFFQGRKDNGQLRHAPDRFDPRAWGGDFVETNGWNTAFSVPHDGAGLASLLGGRAALAAKLDEFFATAETGRSRGAYRRTIHEMTEARDVRMGQYGHSNQPSHHIIYMYAHAGQAWRIQEKVREVMSRLYAGSEIGQGYCGDEDNGEMSAWWLFSALGFYPLRMGSPEYVIGSPLFRRAVVRMDNGNELVVDAPNNSRENVYVQGLTVNGTPWDRVFLPHEMIAGGGTLYFRMGPRPSTWGCNPDALPASLTQDGAVPTTMRDITCAVDGHGEGSDGINVAALFDDTSRTQVTFRTPTPWLAYRLPGQGAEVRYYTLTSGARGDDPRSWTLRGSDDGAQWTVVDERVGESFRWRRQTRPFSVSRPGTYRQYRLDVSASARGEAVSLSQVELLA